MFDAIIIGGGPAGASSAIELARQGRRVALLEKELFPRRKVCGEFLSATSVPVLEQLGVAERWRKLAGPEVRRIALFAENRIIETEMPGRAGYGRALGRDKLDELLLETARHLGVEIFQPARATGLRGQSNRQIVDLEDGQTLCAPVVIAAHGSWERGGLPSHLPRQRADSDLLGFKAHFRDAALAADLMPLLAFPGGYGGMVWADDGRLSISCCLRRDVLAGIRQRGESAGDAVERHLTGSCRGIREVVDEAKRDGAWLAVGPIRPGVRACYADDLFRVGNLAGEAHPVIAEGISMAVQSGWLLGRALDRVNLADVEAKAEAGAAYQRAWRRQFVSRIRAAMLFSRLAMRPEVFRPLAATFEVIPALLSYGASMSGKTRTLKTSGSGQAFW